MTEEKLLKANSLQREIQQMESAINMIGFTHAQKYPPQFIIQIQGMTNNVRIENAELNKKIEGLILDFAKEEIPKLQQQFNEL